MISATDQKIWTDEAFMALSKEDGHYEIVDGELLGIRNWLRVMGVRESFEF